MSAKEETTHYATLSHVCAFYSHDDLTCTKSGAHGLSTCPVTMKKWRREREREETGEYGL